MVRSRVRLLTLAVCVVATLTLASGSGAQPVHASSPEALYQALLRSSIPSAQLPGGFFSATARASKPSSNAKKHHVVGEVTVSIDNEAGIVYDVFPNRSDALADWKDAGVAHRPGETSHLAAPRSFPAPAIIVNGSLTETDAHGRKVTNGLTVIAFAAGSVIVQAFTISTTNTSRGDVPATIALGKLAFRHLLTIERRA